MRTDFKKKLQGPKVKRDKFAWTSVTA